MPEQFATGCLPSPPDARDFPPQALSPEAAAALPTLYRIPLWTPIVHQGQEGTCAGQAGKGVADHLEMVTPSPEAAFARRRSARDLYETARALGGYAAFGEGAHLRDICKAIVKQGICEEAHWPYKAGEKGAPNADATRSRETFKGGAFYRIPENVLDVKAALLKYGPLPIRIETCEGFNVPRVGAPIIRRGEQGSGHAIIILGWSDANRSWRVRNSWGTTWADAGYADLSYDYGVSEAWAIEPVLRADAPPPPAPRPWWAIFCPWIQW